MWKSLTGIAAAAMLTVVAVPAPANAAPIQNAPGLSEAQVGVEQVQRRRWRRHWRGGPRYWRGGPRYHPAYPYRVYPGPYAYAPGPYYRGYYGPPGPFVRFGPFGFGIW